MIVCNAMFIFIKQGMRNLWNLITMHAQIRAHPMIQAFHRAAGSLTERQLILKVKDSFPSAKDPCLIATDCCFTVNDDLSSLAVKILLQQFPCNFTHTRIIELNTKSILLNYNFLKA